MTDDRHLNAETWPQEAESAINDIKNHVKSANISEKLESNNHSIFINITTLENNEYCIEMSAAGFRVVGKQFDVSNIAGEYYETPYALLDKISEAYRKSFGGELMNKLYSLAKESEQS